MALEHDLWPVPVTEHFARSPSKQASGISRHYPSGVWKVHKQRKPLTSFSRTTSATLSLAKSSIRRSG